MSGLDNFRYASGDAVEAWLHELLCLNAAEKLPNLPDRLPHPEECSLYYVERDTLFSYHQVWMHLSVHSFQYVPRDHTALYKKATDAYLHSSADCDAFLPNKGCHSDLLAGIRSIIAAHHGPYGCKPLSQHSQ